MIIENEVKYQVKNIGRINKNLPLLGFVFIKKISQEDYYFSPPGKNFAGTKKYYLRLRKEKAKARFEYHIVINNLKTKEWGVTVDNFNEMLKILKNLGFKNDCIVKKKRLIYQKNNLEVMIDSVKNLGNFVEIEYCGKMNRKISKELKIIAKLLRLKENTKIKNAGYPDLIFQSDNRND